MHKYLRRPFNLFIFNFLIHIVFSYFDRGILIHLIYFFKFKTTTFQSFSIETESIKQFQMSENKFVFRYMIFLFRKTVAV